MRLQTIEQISLQVAFHEAFLPPPRLTVSEWADEFRELSAEGSPEPGRWRTDRARYQRGMMDALSEPGIETVVLMCSSQIGKTEILLNILARFIHLDPCPILFVAYSLEMAEAMSKERFAPMARDTRVLREKIDSRSRNGNNTILHKYFTGGHLTFAGSNSPASLASRPIRLLLMDEVDRYEASAGKEGDPVSLAKRRTNNFWNRLIVLVSTPGNKGESRIEKAWQESDQRHYLVPCPVCGFKQKLEWDRIVYPGKGTDDAQPKQVAYQCLNCEVLIGQEHRAAMLAKGEWQATASSNGIAGFHINELYSPWRDWVDIAMDFETARKDPHQLKVWVNTSQGLPFELQGDKLDWEILYDRALASSYCIEDETLPEGILHLTAGVDVQGDRLEVAIFGWRGRRMWLIEYHKIEGDPLEDGEGLSQGEISVWEQLDRLLERTYTDFWGNQLNILTACVDSGAYTQDVYMQIRIRKGRRNPVYYAIKGDEGMHRDLVKRSGWKDINWHGQKIKRGVDLYIVGVDRAKETLFARSKKPGMLLLPKDVGQDWCQGFCSEVLMTEHRKGKPVQKWKPVPGVRNEPLDTAVYAMAAAELAGVFRVDIEKELEKRQDKVQAEAEAEEMIEQQVATAATVSSWWDEAPSDWNW